MASVSPQGRGAWRGGLEGSFTITIDPLFNGAARRGPQYNEIKRWQFLSGDASNPDRLELDMNAPVTITAGAVEGAPAFDAVRDQKFALAGQIDSLARDIQETPRVEATLGELGSLVDDGSLDEGTAVAAVQRMKHGENVTEELLADFGPEVLGDVNDGSPDDLVGNPDGATEYDTAGSIVQAGVNILIETILTFFPFDKVVDYVPSSITSKIDTAKSKLSKFIDYAVDTILGGSGKFARHAKRNSDDVAQTLLEFIRDEILGTGAELVSQQSKEVTGFKDTLADLLVAIYEDDVGGTTIDDKLRDLDDAFTPINGTVDLDGSESGARNASVQGISDVKGRLEYARGVVNAIDDALNKIGWLGLIAGCLVATGFFAVAGKTLDLALLVVNIAGNLFGVGTSALAMINAVDDHNTALDGVIAGGL